MAREHFLKKEALTPQLLDYLHELKDEADRRGETIAQQALRWVLNRKAVTSVLVGASSTAQLKTNLSVI
jgi:L-glyceraldehyde 3-phosphate reductase